MSNFDDQENRLIAELGVYGCWILKHGKEVGSNNLEGGNKIINTYAEWVKTNDNVFAMMLMNAIDEYVSINKVESTFDNYPKAVNDLINYRESRLE